MNTAPCAINGVNDEKYHYRPKLFTPPRIWRRTCAFTLLLLFILFASLPSMAANNLSEELIHERSDAATKRCWALSVIRAGQPRRQSFVCVLLPRQTMQKSYLIQH